LVVVNRGLNLGVAIL